MTDSRDLRVRILRDRPPQAAGRFVLYWMTATRRLERNFALDQALAWCEKLGKPLLILEALRADYPWACPRHHRVILDAMAEHRASAAEAGVGYYPFVERQAGEGKGLLAALAGHAAVVVTDRHPGFHFPAMLEAARRQVDTRLEAVDSVGLLPLDAAPGPLPSAYVLRRRLQKNLPDWLLRPAQAQPLQSTSGPAAQVPAEISSRWPAATAKELAADFALESRIPLAHAVPASSWRGGSAAARRTLQDFVSQQLDRYDTRRMEATPASGLSMALHYGFLAPHTVLEAILDAEGTTLPRLVPELIERAPDARGKRAGWWGLRPATETFLDQVVTWRELGQRFADQNPDCEVWGSQPDWALATLEAHRGDPRTPVYSAAQFEAAETHDPLWNAAQRCLVREGWLPNYLRMLWGKKILEWSASPDEAWQLLFHLNNLYALDGRDPNSMSGISWVFGRFDRPFGPERPVIGKLRPMSSENTRRKMGLGDFLDRFGSTPSLFV